jgi:site-specific DNA-methyltransferase (adenine-specific)
MTGQAPYTLRNRNPDVLTCIANLSNDEVFTPPELANRMLDTLTEAWAVGHGGADLWSDKAVRFLDPCTKSGIFLREITRRLVKGLEKEFPDLQERVNHILTKQVFGIGITQLTAMLARRSLYCSKHATGKHSIAQGFASDAGNIWFERMEHTWVGTNCKHCGAPRSIFDREEGLETHAYAFIHTEDIKSRLAELFGGDMQFDVIIGNPPYQMKGGAGGSSDSSIYHLFVEQALNLEPRYAVFVTPSRWLAGGRGLDEFRKHMLGSHKLLSFVDYPVSREVFPHVEVKGGVSYFLWSQVHSGPCEVTVIRGPEVTRAVRQLDEFDVFVRDPLAARILRKVLKAGEQPITRILTADTPFGIATNFDDFHDTAVPGDIALYYVRNGKRGIGFVPRTTIRKNSTLIDKWKVLAPKAGSDGGQRIPDGVLGKPWLSPPPSAATQSFLAFWVDNEAEARSLESYYRCKFFRFLVSLRKITQDALRPMYAWVPMQTWDRIWTDDVLYKKYGLSDEEIAYIESVIRPMTRDSDADDD